MIFQNLSTRTLLKKSVASLVAFTFIFSNIALAETPKTSANLADLKKPEVVTDPAKIVIPRDYGLVKTKYTGKDKRLIIHIQDAHCNYEAQSNIRNILETLIKNDGLNLISVEGADGFIDTSWFKAFPDTDIRKEVADYFMKKGEITGPEFLSITSDYPIKLFGAETRSYYIQNLNAFTSSYPLKESTEKSFNQIKAILNKLKTNIYNEELKTLDSKIQDYESKKLPFADYVKVLEALADKHRINLRQYESLFKLISVFVYEKKIDFSIVDKERAALIDELTKRLTKEALTELVTKSLSFKTGKISSVEYYDYLKNLSNHHGFQLAKDYPNVFNYIIYNSVYSRIENENLFNDIKKLEIAVKEKLFTNDDQRTLEKLSRYIDILLGLVNIKLLNDDFDYYKANKAEFTHEIFADFIKKMSTKYGFVFELDPPSDAVKESIPKLEEFYSIAIKRDKALVDNTLQAMKEESAQICVLVTGGFHSEGITKMLESKGVSYMVVCPNITKDVETPYIKILTNQRTPLEEILTDTAVEPKGKDGMLAPILVTWAGPLDEKHIKRVLSDIPSGAVRKDELESLVNAIVGRLSTAKRNFERKSIEIWIKNAIKLAQSHRYEYSINAIKETYFYEMKAGLVDAKLKEKEADLLRRGKPALEGGVVLTKTEKRAIDELVDSLVKSETFNELFIEMYQRGFQSYVVGEVPDAKTRRAMEKAVRDSKPKDTSIREKAVGGALTDDTIDRVLADPTTQYLTIFEDGRVPDEIKNGSNYTKYAGIVAIVRRAIESLPSDTFEDILKSHHVDGFYNRDMVRAFTKKNFLRLLDRGSKFEIRLVQPKEDVKGVRMPAIMMTDDGSNYGHYSPKRNRIYIPWGLIDMLLDLDDTHSESKIAAELSHEIAEYLIVKTAFDSNEPLQSLRDVEEAKAHYAAQLLEIAIAGETNKDRESILGPRSLLDDFLDDVTEDYFKLTRHEISQPSACVSPDAFIRYGTERLNDLVSRPYPEIGNLMLEYRRLQFREGQDISSEKKEEMERETASIEKHINDILNEVNKFRKVSVDSIRDSDLVSVSADDSDKKSAGDAVVRGEYVPQFLFAGAADRLNKTLPLELKSPMCRQDMWAVVKALIKNFVIYYRSSRETYYKSGGEEQLKASEEASKWLGLLNEALRELNKPSMNGVEASKINIDNDEWLDSLIPEEAISGLTMGSKQIIQFRNKLESLVGPKNTTAVLSKQKIILHVNAETEDYVKQDLANNHFYGFNRKNIFIIVQPVFSGFDIINKEAVYRENTRGLPAGHGYVTQQIASPNQAYTIDVTSDGDIITSPINIRLDKYLESLGCKMIATHRINDLDKITENCIDIECIAMARKIMDGDKNSLMVAELVGNPDGQKGGNFFYEVGTNNKFLLEKLNAQTDDLIVKLGGPYNAFRNIYDIRVFGLLAEKGLPFWVRFREGYLYLEGVSGDLSQDFDVNAEGMIVKNKETGQERLIHDFKEEKNVPTLIRFLRRLDANPDFRKLARTFKKDIPVIEKSKLVLEEAVLDEGASDKGVGAIRANGGELTFDEHGVRGVESINVNGEKSVNAIIRNLILEGSAYKVLNEGKALASDKDIKLKINNALKGLGVNIVVIKGLKQALLDNGVAPDLLLHPGIGRQSVYLDEGDYEYLLSLPDGKALMTEAIDHEKAHIDNQRLAEDVIEVLAPSHNVRLAFLTRDMQSKNEKQKLDQTYKNIYTRIVDSGEELNPESLATEFGYPKEIIIALMDKVVSESGANKLKLEMYQNVMKNTPEAIKNNPLVDLSIKGETEITFTKDNLADFDEAKDILKGMNLQSWLERYRKEASVSTAGIRGVQNILYPNDPRELIGEKAIILATVAKALVTKELQAKGYPDSEIHKLASCEVRYNSKEYVELISRIQAALGITTHLPVDKESMPIWMASFLIFKYDLFGGEYVTSSHAISKKTATKDLNNQGSQYIPDESKLFVDKIEEIIKTIKDKGSFTVKLAPADSHLIDEEFMKKINNGIDDYVEYLKKGMATDKNLDLIRSSKRPIYIDVVGGSMYKTMSKIFRKLGILQVFKWLHIKEDPYFHGIGKSCYRLDTQKGALTLEDLSCDTSIIAIHTAKSVDAIFPLVNKFKEMIAEKDIDTQILIPVPDSNDKVYAQIRSKKDLAMLATLKVNFVPIILNEEKVLVIEREERILPVIRTMGYRKSLKNVSIGTTFLLTDPDGDRLITAEVTSTKDIPLLKAMGIAYEILDENRVFAMFMPNQSFLMTIDFRKRMLKESGDWDKYSWFILKTTASAASWDDWAAAQADKTYKIMYAGTDEWVEVKGIPVVNAPVGFKELASLMRKIEKQVREAPGTDVIIEDIFGNKINLGSNPRDLFSGEESGGEIFGPTHLIESVSGRKAVSMREKSAGEAMVITSAISAYLGSRNISLVEYLKEIFENNGIINKFDYREDIVYFNESEPDIAKRKAAEKEGLKMKEENDFFYLAIAVAVRDGKVTFEQAKEFLQKTFPSVDFTTLRDIFFVGDGTYLKFDQMVVEIRPSGTEAKTKGYALGNSVQVLIDSAKVLSGYYTETMVESLKELLGENTHSEYFKTEKFMGTDMPYIKARALNICGEYQNKGAETKPFVPPADYSYLYASRFLSLQENIEETARIFNARKGLIQQSLSESINNNMLLNDLAESVGIKKDIALQNMVEAGLAVIIDKEKNSYNLTEDFFNTKKLENFVSIQKASSSNSELVDLTMLRIERIILNSINVNMFIDKLSGYASQPSQKIVDGLKATSLFPTIVATWEVGNLQIAKIGAASKQLNIVDIINPKSVKAYEQNSVETEFSVPDKARVNTQMLAMLQEYQRVMAEDMARGGYNYRGTGTRQTVEQFFNNYFMEKLYQNIVSFVKERSVEIGEPVEAIATNGIGANDQFMWALVEMYNANKPADAPYWYHVPTARVFARLVKDEKIKPENTLFIDVSRSGTTWEGCEVAMRSRQAGFNKRIAVANGGPLAEIAKRANEELIDRLEKEGKLRKAKAEYKPLIIGMSPDIGGRNMHRKTSIYYTAQTVAGMFLPAMDSKEFAKLNDMFDKANDFKVSNSSIAISAGNFLHGSMRLLGVEHIAFITNTEQLRLIGTEWEQYIMEGSNKADIISMGIHDMAKESPEVLTNFSKGPGKISVGMVILDKGVSSYEKDQERIEALKETMPLMIFTIDSRDAKKDMGAEWKGISPKQQAAFDILWTDLVTVFTTLLRVDANSNPNVKKVREETGTREARAKEAFADYGDNTKDIVGNKENVVAVSYGTPKNPAISYESGKQKALTSANAEERGRELAEDLISSGVLTGRNRLNLFIGTESLETMVKELRENTYTKYENGKLVTEKGWIPKMSVFPLWSHKGLEADLANQAESKTTGPLLADRTVNIFFNARYLDRDTNNPNNPYNQEFDNMGITGFTKKVEDIEGIRGATVYQTNDAMTMPNVKRMAEVSPTILLEFNHVTPEIQETIAKFYKSFIEELVKGITKTEAKKSVVETPKVGEKGGKVGLVEGVGQAAGKKEDATLRQAPMAIVTGEEMPDLLTAEEIDANITVPDIEALKGTAIQLMRKKTLVEDGKVIIISLTDVSEADTGPVSTWTEKLVNDYLKDAVIHVRGSAENVDEVLSKVRGYLASEKIRAVVTNGGDKALKTMTKEGRTLQSVLEGIHEKSKILNIQSKDAEEKPLFVSIPAIENLALCIGFEMPEEKIMRCLQNIGIVVNDNGDPIDPMALLTEKVVRILPRIRPIDMDADTKAQTMARAAVERSL